MVIHAELLRLVTAAEIGDISIDFRYPWEPERVIVFIVVHVIRIVEPDLSSSTEMDLGRPICSEVILSDNIRSIDIGHSWNWNIVIDLPVRSMSG
jgi:hypothetical protein